MTAIEPIPEPTTTTKPWNDLLDELKTRYPKVREPIVAALAVLMQNPGIDVDHTKAVAAANGVRITAASVAGAQRLPSRQDHSVASSAEKRTPATTPRRARPARAANETLDVESLLRETVEKIQAQANSQLGRLKDAMQNAAAVLRAATDA